MGIIILVGGYTVCGTIQWLPLIGPRKPRSKQQTKG